jgi:hypothetical protein
VGGELDCSILLTLNTYPPAPINARLASASRGRGGVVGTLPGAGVCGWRRYRPQDRGKGTLGVFGAGRGAANLASEG